MDNKHTVDLFWPMFLGYFAANTFLCVPGILLLIVGIWIRPCLYIGLCLLAIDLFLSLGLALRTREVEINTGIPNSREAQETHEEQTDERIEDS